MIVNLAVKDKIIIKDVVCIEKKGCMSDMDSMIITTASGLVKNIYLNETEVRNVMAKFFTLINLNEADLRNPEKINRTIMVGGELRND